MIYAEKPKVIFEKTWNDFETYVRGSITKRRAHVGRTFDTKNGHKKRPGIHRGERKLLKNSC